MALSGECEEHGWSWDPADDMACPVCHGIAEERGRVLALPLWHETFETPGLEDDHVAEGCVTCHNIALIKGENK